MKGSPRDRLRADALMRSAIARAEASERFFWWRVAAILLISVGIGWLGITQVERRSAGVRTAHRLALVHDQLREQVEVNRRLAAQLTGKKDPVQLATEAKEQLNMKSPEPNQKVEVR